MILETSDTLKQLESLEETTKKQRELSENTNTKKSRTISENNFEAFVEEKFNHSRSDGVIKQIYQEKSKDGILSLINGWIAWNEKRGLASRSIRTMASPIKSMLLAKYNINIKSDKLDHSKIKKEARGIMTADMIEKLVNHADKSRKVMYLLQSCSAMRIGEMMLLQRKHLDTTKERIQINLTAEMTKSSEARITFVSKECEKLLLPYIKDMKEDTFLFNQSRSTEECAFRRIAELAGFTERFETTNYHKINSHSIRAYAITQMNRLNQFGFGHIIAGHGFYMKTYNRPEPKELLEDFIKAEQFLQVFNREDPDTKKNMAVMSKQLKELKSENEELSKNMRTIKENLMNIREIKKQVEKHEVSDELVEIFNQSESQ